MRKLGAKVHIVAPPVKRIEVVGEGFPIPFQARMKCRSWNFLDPFHKVYQVLTITRAHWRETNATIAEGGRRDTVPT